jgi:hypothetical protein
MFVIGTHGLGRFHNQHIWGGTTPEINKFTTSKWQGSTSSQTAADEVHRFTGG